jgi:putative Mn2+ efflux pump MntP
MLAWMWTKPIGVVFVMLGVVVSLLTWRDTITRHNPPFASSVAGICGPLLVVYGLAMLVFSFDEVMTDYKTYPGRKRMNLLGWVIFLFAISTGIGNYALLIYLSRKE